MKIDVNFKTKQIANTNYAITDSGSVINLKSGKECKQCVTAQGYHHVNIKINGKYKMYAVHRLVAQYFLSNPDCKPCVNHIDGNKLNNNVSNLEWVTYAENQQHAYDNSLNIAVRGVAARRAIFNSEDVRHIRYFYSEFKYSIKQLSDMYDCATTTIANIIYMKTYQDVA